MLDSKKLFGALEKAFVISAFILFSGALLTLIREITGGITKGSNETDPVSQAVFLLVYAITACLVVVRRRQLVRVVAGDKLLWLLIGIAILSVFWSAAPEITLRRSIALAGTTLLGVYVAMRFSIREQLQLLAWALGVAALLSLLFVLALPDYGIMSVSGMKGVGPPFTGFYSAAEIQAEGWRGVYSHKNAFGRTMTLAVWVFMALALSEPRYRWVYWAGFGLSMGLLLLSNSVTSLLIFLIMLLLVPLYRITRWPHTLAVPFLALAILLLGSAALWGVAQEGTVLGLLNRDVTLTGRTELWPAVIDMIWKRPWLGYGYSAFWQGWEGPSAYVLLVAHFDPLNAHSGYLELLLNLGLLGAVVFVLVYSRAALRAITWARLTKETAGIWPSAYLTYLLLYNVTESGILTRNSITWVLFVTVILSISRDRLKKHLRDESPATEIKAGPQRGNL